MNRQYMQGFVEKCADLEQTVKYANKFKRFLRLTMDALKRYQVPEQEFIGEGTMNARGPRGVRLGALGNMSKNTNDTIAGSVRSSVRSFGDYSDKPIYRRFSDTGKNMFGMKKKLPLLTDKDLANQSGFAQTYWNYPSEYVTGKARLDPDSISKYLKGKSRAMYALKGQEIPKSLNKNWED